MENGHVKSAAAIRDIRIRGSSSGFDPKQIFAPIKNRVSSSQASKQGAMANSQDKDVQPTEMIEEGEVSASASSGDECAALTRQIQNDNFNVKFKIHMINKMLDEGSPASSQLLEDLRNMESKVVQSQQRYERLEKKLQLKKRKKRNKRKSLPQQKQRQLNGWKGKGVSTVDSLIQDAPFSYLEELSFSAVEREQDVVEQKFQDLLGTDIFKSKSPTLVPSDSVQPKFKFPLNLASQNLGSNIPDLKFDTVTKTEQASPIHARLKFDIPSPISSISSADDNVKIPSNVSSPKPRKITRFASTNSTSSVSSAPSVIGTEPEVLQTPIPRRWNIPDIKHRKQTPGVVPVPIRELEDLSITDTEEDPFSSHSSPKNEPQTAGFPLKAEYEEELQVLQDLVATQNDQIAEQANQIKLLTSLVRQYQNTSYYPQHVEPTKEPIPIPQPSQNTTSNTIYYDPVSTLDADQQNSKHSINHIIAGLTQIYDATRKSPGIFHETISAFQDCLLDLTLLAQDYNGSNLAEGYTRSRPVVPLDDASAQQQLLLYQYESHRQNAINSDLRFINSLQSRQIQMYKAANKTRIQFLRSMGLLPADTNSSNSTNRYIRGRGYLSQDTRPRSKGADRLRALVYCIMGAQRFAKRLEIRNQDKKKLKIRLVELSNGG